MARASSPAWLNRTMRAAAARSAGLGLVLPAGGGGGVARVGGARGGRGFGRRGRGILRGSGGPLVPSAAGRRRVALTRPLVHAPFPIRGGLVLQRSGVLRLDVEHLVEHVDPAQQGLAEA